jgi:hypothetical protein
MIFGIIYTISGKGFLLNLKIHPAQTATCTPFLHPGQHKETDRRALGSRVPHPSAEPEQRRRLTASFSPTTRCPPPPSAHLRAPVEATKRRNGGVEQAWLQGWRMRQRCPTPAGLARPRRCARRGGEAPWGRGGAAACEKEGGGGAEQGDWHGRELW